MKLKINLLVSLLLLGGLVSCSSPQPEPTPIPTKLEITSQPLDVTVKYYERSTFTVEVNDPTLVKSYLWQQDKNNDPYLPHWRDMDGTSASTKTLIYQSDDIKAFHMTGTESFRCQITDINGNVYYSQPAKRNIDKTDNTPVMRIGDYAFFYGESFDLSKTALGTGVISSEITSDKVLTVTFDEVNFSNEKRLTSDIASAPGFEIITDQNDIKEYHLVIKGNCVFYNNYLNSKGEAGHPFTFSTIGEDTNDNGPVYIEEHEDGGKLTIIGGTDLIYATAPLIVDCDMLLIGTPGIKSYGIRGSNVTIKPYTTIIGELGGAIITNVTTTYHDVFIKVENNCFISSRISVYHVEEGASEVQGIHAYRDITINGSVVDLSIYVDGKDLAKHLCEANGIIGISGDNIYISDSQIYVEFKGSKNKLSKTVGFSGIESSEDLDINQCDVFISCDDDNFRDVAGLVSDHGTLKIKESVVEIELKACGKVRGLTSNGEPMEFTDSVININIDGYPSTLFKSEIIGIKTNGVKFEITTYGFILINVNESGGNCIMSYVDTYDTERVDPIDEKDSKITLINASITTPASFVRKPLNFETYVGYDKKYQCFETIYAIEASEKPVSQLIIK